MVIYVLVYIFGVVVGCIINGILLFRTYKKRGSLIIDTSDPEADPYLFLELSIPVNLLKHNKRVTLDIKHTQK